MRNAVRFRSTKYNTTEVKEYFINDICFGEDLAHELADGLKTKGLKIYEPWQEDWGWQFGTSDCLISVGFDGEEWRVDIGQNLGFFDKLRGKTVDASQIVEGINAIIKSDPANSDVQWFVASRPGQELDFADSP